jgi:hypothetical protein
MRGRPYFRADDRLARWPRTLDPCVVRPPDTVPVPMTLARAEISLRRLQRALRNNRSVDHCHKLWSRVIRGRDDDSCVVCGSPDGVEAHHIVRKTFFPGLRFETGNGITLCAKCHRAAHRGFNGRPDLSLPMDAQGGERIELITALFGHLVSAARHHRLITDDYYHLSDRALSVFREFQGIPQGLEISGSRLEQAWRIWSQTPRATLNALVQANGYELPPDHLESGPLAYESPDGDFLIFSFPIE